ncbi:MAG: NrfD/PsrC family molybdoenzyme membrane anchor subunit [Actinomycetota bacterium]
MSGDGRHIDPRVGTLSGEAAQQKVRDQDPKALAPFDVWRSAAPVERGGDGYYDRPVVKEPVWIWAVPAYFYVGGAAGAAVVLGEASHVLADSEVDDLVRNARRIGAVGGALGTALLIHDLGRPERFLNMLRVFRPTSAMSVGSWILAAASPLFAASALLPHAGGMAGRLGNAAGKAAALLGLPLAGYTAVLLSSSAVPLWLEARRNLPFLFSASAMSSAAALLELGGLNETEDKIVRRFGAVAQVIELVSSALLERRVAKFESVGAPLEQGATGALWTAAKLATVTTLALGLLPGRTRSRSIAKGLLGSAGGVALRFATFHAGKASARDPKATFERQRAVP